MTPISRTPHATCETCLFFSTTGACRRYPPVVQYESGALIAQARTRWPRVSPADWCGEYFHDEAGER